MRNKDLLKRLRRLGFPLFETEEAEDANLTLADVAASKDYRLWEGFPVVLAASADKGLFDYNKALGCLRKPLDRPTMSSLVAMSLALYENIGRRFSWAKPLHDLLSRDKKKEYRTFLAALKKNSDLDVAGRKMSADRLRSVFGSYFKKEGADLQDLLLAKEEMGLEYALSQVFSPKQKELFLKKLKGEILTKTEREYFSRAVKKKVLALANADLHRLSRKLLGE